jgi:hypothetical protein
MGRKLTRVIPLVRPFAVDIAAAAIANARGNRRGVPNIINILEILPPSLVEEVTEDAKAALEAVGYQELTEALEESVKLQAHYAELLNMHDGGERLVFKTVAEWRERLTEVRKTK